MKLEKQRTLVIIKPDGIQRSLIGEIIKRFERVGLKFVAFKFVVPTREQVFEHYNKDDAWFLKKGNGVVEAMKANGVPVEKEAIEYGRDIIELLAKYFMSGPTLALVIEGNSSVAVVRKLTGETESTSSLPGTIRGDFTNETYEHCNVTKRGLRNLIHCSETVEDANREIGVWFRPEEIINYRLVQEQILYDVNLDGILE